MDETKLPIRERLQLIRSRRQNITHQGTDAERWATFWDFTRHAPEDVTFLLEHLNELSRHLSPSATAIRSPTGIREPELRDDYKDTEIEESELVKNISVLIAASLKNGDLVP